MEDGGVQKRSYFIRRKKQQMDQHHYKIPNQWKRVKQKRRWKNRRILAFFLSIVSVVLIFSCGLLSSILHSDNFASRQNESSVSAIINSNDNIKVPASKKISQITQEIPGKKKVPTNKILSGEVSFFNLIKSCAIPKRNDPKLKKDEKGTCPVYFTPESFTKQKEMRRIAILTTPGSIGSAFSELLESSILKRAKEGSYASNFPEIEIMQTSSVPPYGYGKNHGYWKIIRLVIDPLETNISDTLLFAKGEAKKKSDTAMLSAFEKYSDVSMIASGNDNIRETKKSISNALNEQEHAHYENNLIKKIGHHILRQNMRWHCRLSHVAAHTPMISVRLSDIVSKHAINKEKIENIMHFVFATTEREGEKVGSTGNVKKSSTDEDMRDKSKARRNEDGLVFLNAVEEVEMASSRFFQSSSNLPMVGQKVNSMMDYALQDELLNTKNLSKWPCPSFWSFNEYDEMGKPESEIITNLGENSGSDESSERTVECYILATIARAMSPNCQYEFVTCTVMFDFCEESGDLTRCPKLQQKSVN